MLKVLFTLDYEIHGNGEGSPYALMVEPTNRLMDLFEAYGAQLTIMADIAEILKFKEYMEQKGRDDFHYEFIAEQLRSAIRRGHDVQLHIHPSYFNAHFDSGKCVQDMSEYDFASLSLERLNYMVKLGKHFLECLLRPVNGAYQCSVFRAANWSMSPSVNVVRTLVENGIKIDSSVFKHGSRKGRVSFDYSNAHSDLVPWPVDEHDICLKSDSGKLLEVPIYCERRWIGAFLTRNRISRALLSRAHQFASEDSPKQSLARKAVKFVDKVSMVTRLHAWKADFNQCTGAQLIRALNRASKSHDANGAHVLPFVLIGHSKLFTPANARSLTPFLKQVSLCPARFQFGKFDLKATYA